MSFIDGWRHRWRSWTHPREHERDLADELAFHVEREAAQQSHNAPNRIAASDAVAAARRQVGNLTWAQEETRRVAGLAAADAFLQDVRFAVRSFRRTPGFTTIVVLTLAIGIGFTTAIFSAVDALLLRPLPFHDPDRLMSVSLTLPEQPSRRALDDVRWSYPKFLLFRHEQQVFSDVTVWTHSQFTIRTPNGAYRVSGEYVDSRYLPTLGVPLTLGSNFASEGSQRTGVPQTLIIGYNLWRNVFNSDSGVIGRSVQIDGYTFDIVGVAAKNFRGVSGDGEIWMPAASAPLSWANDDPYNHKFFLVARLAPGVSAEHAAQVTAKVGAEIDAQFPSTRPSDGHWSAVARELDAARASPTVRRTLFVLLGAVVLMLCTACANVANLLLVRAVGRQREVAVRLALGATRGRLGRQLLAESVVLAAVGGAASIIVGILSVKLLASVQTLILGQTSSLAGLGTARFSVIQFDVTAFAVTATLALLTGLVFGFAPALHATRMSLSAATKGGDVTATGARRPFAIRHALTIAEITFAVVLLAGSGLMIRSTNHLMSVRPGFDASQTLVLRVNRSIEWSRDSIETFYDGALARIKQIPGVTVAGMSDCPPLARCETTGMFAADRPRPDNDHIAPTGIHWITPDWPTAMRIPLLRGRLFTRYDDDHSGRVVLLSASAAKLLWPGADPIGRPIGITSSDFSRDTAIGVGVVGDVLYDDLSSGPRSEVYVSYYQTRFTYRMMFFVRTLADPAQVTRAVLNTFRKYTPAFPVYEVATMEARVDESIAYVRVTTSILTAFAAVSLLLAMMGTYGVVAYTVSQRTREIGVRVALGATGAHISRLVLRHAVMLTGAGLTIGFCFAIVATRVLRSMLFDVAPTDPVTLAGIMLLLAASVLAATWIPARRALRVTPSTVLRAQ